MRRNSPGDRLSLRLVREVHERLMHLADQTQRQRELGEPGESVLQRDYVVANLAQVIALALCCGGTGLVDEQLRERRHRALDARREHCLLAEVRGDQNVWIGEQATQPSELAQGAVG